MSFYEAYCQRWHDYVDIMSFLYTRELLHFSDDALAIPLPFGLPLIDVLMFYYRDLHSQNDDD